MRKIVPTFETAFVLGHCHYAIRIATRMHKKSRIYGNGSAKRTHSIPVCVVERQALRPYRYGTEGAVGEAEVVEGDHGSGHGVQ